MTKTSRNRPGFGAGGKRKQQGTPEYAGKGNHLLRAHGLKMRGAVLATYVQLDGDSALGSVEPNPVAVYCDVLAYGVGEGMHTSVLRRVPVFSDTGLHDGRVWQPRATTLDMSGSLDLESARPRDLDGDHVLVEFLEDDLTQPFISRRITHPRLAISNENLAEAGHRMKLKLADGQPDLYKHHGTFYGVTKNGDFVIDTTRAHDGSLASDGKETPKDAAGYGNVDVRVSSKNRFRVVGLAPDGTTPKFELILEDNELTLRLSDGETLALVGKDGATTMKVGSGARHVAIVEELKALYNNLKSAYDGHTHTILSGDIVTTGTAASQTNPDPVVVPAPLTSPAPAWETAIESTKVSIPPNG